MNPAAAVGFAQAAGQLISGDGAVERALGRGRIVLIVLAKDAGAVTTRRFQRLAGQHRVPVLHWGAKADWGAWIGERPRAVLAVSDPHFAKMLSRSVAGSGNQLR